MVFSKVECYRVKCLLYTYIDNLFFENYYCEHLGG